MTTTNDIKSSLITLEALRKNYANTLIEYKQAQKDVTDSFNNINNSTSLKSIPYSTFSGPANLGTTNVTNEDVCSANCSSNPNCSGATYNMSTSECTAYSGNGNIIASINEDDHELIS